MACYPPVTPNPMTPSFISPRCWRFAETLSAPCQLPIQNLYLACESISFGERPQIDFRVRDKVTCGR